MLRNSAKKIALFGLLAAGTTLTASAQQQIGPPSDTWKVPACQKIVGTPAVTFTLDEGATLKPATQPLTGIVYASGLAALGKPNVLLATVNSSVYRSTDAGCQWRLVADLGAQVGYELLTLTAAGYDRAYIWSDNRNLLLRIDGETITPLRGTGTSIVGVAVDRRSGDVVRVGDDRGQIWESVDAGASWAPVGSPAIRDLWAYRVAFDPANFNHAVVGTVNLGALVTFDGGNTWTQATGFTKTTANVFNLVVSPADPNIVWAMGIDLSISDTDPSHGRYIFLSLDGGLNFTRTIAEAPGVKLINGPTMAAHPANPNVFYFVFGSSFQNYGTDLFRYDIATGQLTVNHNPHHGIRAIEFSPASVMYLGLVSEQH